MRVLLDEQLPRHLAGELGGHDVSTVQQRGWAGLKNGELLGFAADAGVEILVTADRNLQFQQNLSQSRFGIIVLVATSNALEDLLPLVPKLLAAIGVSPSTPGMDETRYRESRLCRLLGNPVIYSWWFSWRTAVLSPQAILPS